MANGKVDHGVGGDFDLSQFFQIFFEEAGENLEQMEQLLLRVSLMPVDDELLNAVFRCAHSVKGGAATFGFSDVTELTHHMESLLDRLRRHELHLNSTMIDVLLESADVTRSLLTRHQSGGSTEPTSTQDLIGRISALVESDLNSIVRHEEIVGSIDVMENTPRSLTVLIGPLEREDQADEILNLFNDIPGLGYVAIVPEAKVGYRIFKIETTSSNEDLLDLFAFHVSKSKVEFVDNYGSEAVADSSIQPAEISKVVAGYPLGEEWPPDAPLASSPWFGFFDEQPVKYAPDPSALIASPEVIHAVGASTRTVVTPETSTIRVGINKVDQLINLVGELVITQAMLAQNARGLDPGLNQKLIVGLADLDRNTRDLQESVMSIRMIPMSIVFNRFPRMLRDLAGKLGKKVNFLTVGEATELDKGLIEKITDPLTHLVRNSCDHGIETPADRLRAGKSEVGTITLSASHQGGAIVIEVRDDGRGMSREKILTKARQQGMSASDLMSDAEVWNLIFAPGFSTADLVTDVSGRGVGMDVVKRNITALNGTVEIESTHGSGMKVSVRLPLTLAIMDGMSIGVGDEVYILPLSSVVESFQIKDEIINTVGQSAKLVLVRDEYMPVVELGSIFQVPRSSEMSEADIMVVVESDGCRVALLVNELRGQQQVVVKNLESNYRKVSNISGATILGDGKVALILDTAALVQSCRH